MAKSSKAKKTAPLEFIGYDLGHGETAIGRAFGSSAREPEIVEFRGERTFVTAVAKTGRDVQIGAQAVNLAAIGTAEKTGLIGAVLGKTGAAPTIWVKFKDRDQTNPDTKIPTQLFTKTLFDELKDERKILGSNKSHFIVGCPSGWSEAERDKYRDIFSQAGLKHVRIVPESRAALMTALEQGYLSLDAARGAVLIVDIGSSTTDFTFCRDLDAEDVGHNALGSGLLDGLIFERNLARQPDRDKIEKLISKYPHYRPVMEYWCRLAKEQYFNGEEQPVEMLRRLPVGRGVIFEIRLDKSDADIILSQKIEVLTDTDGRAQSWPQAFHLALRHTVDSLGGREPETVLLTGGASRLPLIAPACESAFPEAKILRGAEPEFAIARGLSWLGRFEHLHDRFKKAVTAQVSEGGQVYETALASTNELGVSLAPALVDALIASCIIPAFQDWRAGKIQSLDEIEGEMDIRVRDWLKSEDAQLQLRPVIEDWFAGLQRQIERITDPLCRDHGLPAMVLSLDDSAHVSRHLEGLSVNAPHVATIEQDTVLAGTTMSAILIGVVLAKANLLLPLLAHPAGLVAGGALGIGSLIFGRKAIGDKMRGANIPLIARKTLTNGRLEKAANAQRGEMIISVAQAWDEAASERFSQELVTMLQNALIERTDERAVLFMV